MRLLLFSIIWIFMGGVYEILADESKATISSDWRSVELDGTRESLALLEGFLSDSEQWSKEERIDYLLKVIEESINLNNDTLVVLYSDDLGTFYSEIDSMALSLMMFNKALDYTYDARSRQRVFNSLGYLHYESRDYNTAIDYYFKSMEAVKELNNGSEAFTIGNLSQAYFTLNDYQNSLKYLKRSIQYSLKMEGPERYYNQVFDYSHIIKCYSKLNHLDSAQQTLNLVLDKIKFIDTIQERKYKNACFEAYYSMSQFYFEIAKLEEAKTYIQKIRDFAYEPYLPETLLLEAEYQLLSKNYNAALDILNSDVMKKELLLLKENLELKVRCYEGLGDYMNIIELKDKLIKLQEETAGNDRIKFSTFASVKHETFQKNEEIKSLRLDKKVNSLTIQNQRYIVFITLVLIAFLALVAFVFWQKIQNRKSFNDYLEKEIALKTENLRQSNKELRTLSFAASHDIKEPLRNISNYVGLIKRKLPDAIKSDLDVYFETISRSSSQLYTLVEDISRYISMPKDTVIDKVSLNLNRLVEDVFFSLETLRHEKQGQLINEGFPEQLMTNSTILFVVLKNLVENGLKFNTSQTPKVSLSYASKGTNHYITVSDNGIGIEEEYQKMLFDGFKRLHNRSEYKGSGLGLTMAKLMVEKLGGHIELESRVGEGSNFVVVIPK